MPAEPNRILIVLFGAIGDVTRALPLACRIREAMPDASLSWAVEPKSAPVVTDHPALSDVIVFDRARGVRGYLSFIREIRRRRFDVVLDLQRHAKSGLTSRLSGARRRIGFHRTNAKELNWLFNNERIAAVDNWSAKIEHYQLFGDRLGIDRQTPLRFGVSRDAEAQPRIDALIASRLDGDAGDGPFAALIMGSSWPSRFWERESYVELARLLHRHHGLIPLLVGGPGEKEFADAVSGDLGELPHANLVGATSLADLFQLLFRCRVAIGPDSGPMHMAAAVGIPVVSFWGATSPLRSAPYGSEEYVVGTTVPCAPCYRRECPGLGMVCMKEITPLAVLTMVEKAMKDRDPAVAVEEHDIRVR